ncbi:MAG TPA: iron ABC transporter permease [Candidatus Latescibacteria bacterium]|nr:iron ABC transporter permease [Candidatus Latescibacterota bacterium]
MIYEYQKKFYRRWATVNLSLLIAVIAGAFLALSIGPSRTSLIDVLGVFLGERTTTPEWVSNVILRIRLPRIILAIVAGASLSVSGVVFQAVLGNPLADPYILGVSSGAVAGAALVTVFGIGKGTFGQLVIPTVSFVGSLLAMILVYIVARIGGRVRSQTLLLAGVIVNFFLGAVIMLLMSISNRELHEIVYLLMGNLGYVFSERTIWMLWIAGGLTLLGAILLLWRSRELNALSLGEESATQLGIDIQRFRLFLLFIVSLMIGAAVSLCGLIGFVGLIVPHATRMLSGPDHRTLIPAAALSGAVFLILADTLARTVAPIEIPVGVVTAIVGGPFFIYLLRTRRPGYI